MLRKEDRGSMKVNLIAYTPEPLKIIYTAARTCYSKRSPYEIFSKDVSQDRMIELVRKIIDKGHTSVLEHINFTFAIEGISRACSHQLVRHRIASYSQQSQRYCAYDSSIQYIIPPGIKKDKDKLKIFRDTISSMHQAYRSLLYLGVEPEDARFVLPNATPTNIIVTMNARGLLHFFKLRCHHRAQWEIRELAKEMLRVVKEIAPIIFEKAEADLKGIN